MTKTWRVSKTTDTGRYIVIEAVGGQVICEIDPGPEAEKNAYRIAASPELYEACLCVRIGGLSQGTVEKIDAALAKVKGKL